MRILVTGGAGFIGRRLVKSLASSDAKVIVVDNLLPQVHGDDASLPHWEGDVEFIKGDVLDTDLMRSIAAQGLDIVYHLAAMTGVGQSMYNIANYVDVNSHGTAKLLEALVLSGRLPKKIVLSSSRAVYGDGHFYCADCRVDFYPALRSEEDLANGIWDPPCPRCGTPGSPLDTSELSPLRPTSVYGATKLEQENLCQIVSRAYGIPTTVLRYFNVYGPGQSPTNPYTGILSIFSRRFLNGQGIEIYEDGHQLRDFVFIDDVVRANVIAGESPSVGVFNISSGETVSVYDVAKILGEVMGRPEDILAITGKYRVGDIRHCYGSWKPAEDAMGYVPKVFLREGLERLVQWMSTQNVLHDGLDPDEVAKEELKSRGLFR